MDSLHHILKDFSHFFPILLAMESGKRATDSMKKTLLQIIAVIVSTVIISVIGGAVSGYVLIQRMEVKLSYIERDVQENRSYINRYLRVPRER